MRVKAKMVKGIRMLEKGADLIIERDDGTELNIEINDPEFMPLIEGLACASFSLTESRGGIAALQLVDAQCHRFEDGQIGIEVAFGQTGTLYLACPHSVATKLLSEIQKRLSSVSEKHTPH